MTKPIFCTNKCRIRNQRYKPHLITDLDLSNSKKNVSKVDQRSVALRGQAGILSLAQCYVARCMPSNSWINIVKH